MIARPRATSGELLRIRGRTSTGLRFYLLICKVGLPGPHSCWCNRLFVIAWERSCILALRHRTSAGLPRPAGPEWCDGKPKHVIGFSAKSGSFPDDKRRVLDATDIVRLIGEHLALKQKGREYVGLCPFHDDHSPSMCVVPHKQMYHCFSCGAGGDAITFVREYHKMSFREALEHLAERAGIQLTPRALFGPAQRSGQSGGEPGVGEHDERPTISRATLLAANQTAAGFFRAILNHPEHGKPGRDLIARRGLSPEMVQAFDLGLAPDMWDGLLQTITRKGMDLGTFRAAGLLKARENGSGYYDSFRNRLIFPIHDQLGRVIAFGGRRINDADDPKYLNSPESEVFNKSATLYGLHQAAQEIRRTRQVVVCEGYMDAIACHQAGITNVVATLGTALTATNARILQRLCDTVILLFDGDAAGRKAAERAVEIFFAEPVDVRIATLAAKTDAKDPDELLKRPGGTDVLREVFKAAIDPLELLFARVRDDLSGQGLSVRGRVVNDFVARLCELGLERVDKVRLQLIYKQLSSIAGVDWDTIASEVADRRRRVRPRLTSDAPMPEPKRPLTVSEHLLGCVLCEPSLQHSLTEEQSPLLDPESFDAGPMREVARAVASLVVDEQPPSLQAVLGVLDDVRAQAAAARLAQVVETLTEGDSDRLHSHWRERLREAAMRAGTALMATGALQPPDPVADLDDPLRRIREARERREKFGSSPHTLPKTGPT